MNNLENAPEERSPEDQRVYIEAKIGYLVGLLALGPSPELRESIEPFLAAARAGLAALNLSGADPEPEAPAQP